MPFSSRIPLLASAVLFASLSLALGGPVPTDGPDLKKQIALVNEVYKTDIDTAKTPELKAAFAAKLLAAATEEKDPTAKYVLLTRARDFAADSGDPDLVSSIYKKLERSFDIPKIKGEAAAAVAKNLRTTEQAMKFLTSCATEIDSALAADDFDSARLISTSELSIARQSNDNAIIKPALARVDQIRDTESAFTDSKRAATTLASTPSDPDANLKLGRYLCLFKAQWNKGLPMLAKGNDDLLKAAAILDIAGGKTADEKTKIGDGWWDASAKAQGLAIRRTQERAVKWYKEALPMMEKGIARYKLEKRIADFQGTVTQVAATQSTTPKTSTGTSTAGTPITAAERDLVGTWGGKSGNMDTLNADHTATESKSATVTGTWVLADGEIRITFSNGWKHVISQQEDKYVLKAYAPRAKPDAKPSSTTTVDKKAASN